MRGWLEGLVFLRLCRMQLMEKGKFEKKEVRATAEQNLIVIQIVVVRRHCFTISITG